MTSARMAETSNCPPKVTRNKDCLQDGKPCVPAGDGGCMACDDGLGNYNQRPVDCDEKAFDGGPLCEDCPPVGYPTDKTRCDECPRRKS